MKQNTGTLPKTGDKKAITGFWNSDKSKTEETNFTNLTTKVAIAYSHRSYSY